MARRGILALPPKAVKKLPEGRRLGGRGQGVFAAASK